MLTQIKRSLDNALFSANYMGEMSHQGDVDYNHKPVSEIKRMFSNTPVRKNVEFSNRGTRFFLNNLLFSNFHLPILLIILLFHTNF